MLQTVVEQEEHEYFIGSACETHASAQMGPPVEPPLPALPPEPPVPPPHFVQRSFASLAQMLSHEVLQQNESDAHTSVEHSSQSFCIGEPEWLTHGSSQMLEALPPAPPVPPVALHVRPQKSSA